MSYLPSLFQEGFTKVKVRATVIHTSVKITCGQARAWHIWGAQQVPAATTVQVQYDSLASQHIQLRLSTIKARDSWWPSLLFSSAFSGAGTVLCALHTAFLLTTNSWLMSSSSFYQGGTEELRFREVRYLAQVNLGRTGTYGGAGIWDQTSKCNLWHLTNRVPMSVWTMSSVTSITAVCTKDSFLGLFLMAVLQLSPKCNAVKSSGGLGPGGDGEVK